MIKKLFLVILLMIVSGIFVAGCNFKPDATTNGQEQTEQTEQAAGSPGPTTGSVADKKSMESFYARSDNGLGGVQVEVKWITPEYVNVLGNEELAKKYDFDRNLVFEIVMTTHMGDLREYPILEKTKLIVNDQLIKPAKWDISNNEPHHPIGFLIFPINNSIQKQDFNLELNLKDLNDIPDRKFSWQQK